MGTSDEHALSAYLADRDVPCPGCGYNLRDGSGPVCPECGKGLRLSLVPPSWGRGYVLFLTLAFGWVFLAGAMNACRQWQSIYSVALNSAVVQITAQSITVMPGSGGTMTFRAQSGATFTMRNGRIVPLGGPGALNWSAVPFGSWASFGWWGGLAVLGLIGVARVVPRRKRLSYETPPRRLVAFAAALFACYAAWHLVTFAGEVIALF